MNYVIINYNTHELVNALISSIYKKCGFNSNITVIDNSHVSKFKTKFSRVKVIDNTDDSIVQINKAYNKFNKDLMYPNACTNPSFRHATTVQYYYDHTSEPFILLDSDTIIKSNLNELVDNTKLFVSGITYNFRKEPCRLAPFVSFINVPLCKSNGIKFCDNIRIHPNENKLSQVCYDTGGSFYEDCIKSGLPYKEINPNDYIFHLGSASYKCSNKYRSNNCNLNVQLNWLDSLKEYHMLTRYDIINNIINLYDFKSFLEIGTSKGKCYNEVNALIKVSVDPDLNTNANYKITSDEFFAMNKNKFDLIFIDGLHEHDQVYKDIKNGLKCLNKGGVIVMHDCHPLCEEHQLHLFSCPPGNWTGDCWKAFVKARAELPYEMYVMDHDWGCGIIDTNLKKTSDVSSLPTDMELMTYQDFIDHPEWMNFKAELQIQG